MTIKQTLKDIIGEGITADDCEAFEIWLRMEISKMVSEADCRHLIYTSFDQGLAAGVKNAIIRDIFTKWEL